MPVRNFKRYMDVTSRAAEFSVARGQSRWLFSASCWQKWTKMALFSSTPPKEHKITVHMFVLFKLCVSVNCLSLAWCCVSCLFPCQGPMGPRGPPGPTGSPVSTSSTLQTAHEPAAPVDTLLRSATDRLNLIIVMCLMSRVHTSSNCIQ